MNPATLTERKREAILQAALIEFGARGFGETSMDRIAEKARVSKRTVYNHFSSKDALFDAIADELSARVERVTDQRYRPNEPLDRQLRAIVEQYLDMLVSPCTADLARVTLGEMIRSPELARNTYNLIRERHMGLARWLEQASNAGVLRLDDPVWAADQLLGLLKSFAFWPQVLGDQPPPDDTCRARILDSSVAMFLAQYGEPGRDE